MKSFSIHSLITALMALLLLSALPLGAQAADAAGYLARVFGQVTIDGQTAQRGATFDTGATIITAANSNALVKFKDGQSVFLRAATELHVDQYNYDPDKPQGNTSSVSLLKGGMRALTGLLGKSNPEAVTYKTPTGTIGIRGTEFMVSIVGGTMYVQGLAGYLTGVPGFDLFGAGDFIALSLDGQVLSSGDAARDAAHKARAFTEMNTIRMDTDKENSVLQWGPWRIGSGQGRVYELPTPEVAPVGASATDTVSTDGVPVVTQSISPSTGMGKFERIDTTDY